VSPKLARAPLPPADAIREATGAAGAGAHAVSVAALTNAVGFAALMAADYRAMQDLGLPLSIGISLTIVASVVVLPALLVVLRRAGLGSMGSGPRGQL